MSQNQGDSVCCGYCPAKRTGCDNSHNESVTGHRREEEGSDVPDDNRDMEVR